MADVPGKMFKIACSKRQAQGHDIQPKESGDSETENQVAVFRGFAVRPRDRFSGSVTERQVAELVFQAAHARLTTPF
jgi:hypothetical protein